MPPMTFQQLRDGQGLTLDAVAARCALSRQAVHQIETGRVPNPRYETVVKLASALGATTEVTYAAIQQSVIERMKGAA